MKTVYRSALMLSLTIALTATVGAAEQEIVEEFDDWSKICTASEETEKVCQVVQSATQNDSGKLIFQTSVGYVADADRPVMYLTAPLGIYLPRGVSIFVDDAEDGKQAMFQRCDGNGCLAVMVLEPDFISMMKKGASAKLVFAPTAQQNVSLPLSLTGFTRAFDSLKGD